MKIKVKSKKKDTRAYPIPKTCDFCGSRVVLTSNKIIYGREYGNGLCYVCTNPKCRAHVGVHTGTIYPLGRLSNKEMRMLKMECHALFDPLWNRGSSRGKRRQAAYRWLAKEMRIPASQCHFGWFDEKQLQTALEILKSGRCYHESE